MAFRAILILTSRKQIIFLPSLHETFSMVVSEAHILETPVIASDIPIMREMLGMRIIYVTMEIFANACLI